MLLLTQVVVGLFFGVSQNGSKYTIKGLTDPEKIEQDFVTALRSNQKFNVRIDPICKKYIFEDKAVLAFTYLFQFRNLFTTTKLETLLSELPVGTKGLLKQKSMPCIGIRLLVPKTVNLLLIILMRWIRNLLRDTVIIFLL